MNDVEVVTTINDALDLAHLSITMAIVGADSLHEIVTSIHSDDGNEVFSKKSKASGGLNAVLEAAILNPRLWWPNGHGAQNLYTAEIQLLDKNSKLWNSSTTQFGVRRIELIQRPLNKPGKTFMFSVNGEEIFAQGGNWIPADMILPTITRERYFDWIELAAHNNLNMIRVWGGGIYETEDFFDACDEMGMLVWMDYAFACGDYPVYDGLMDSIRKEAEVHTIRLRNRASLALLCGGNEDFMLMDEWQK